MAGWVASLLASISLHIMLVHFALTPRRWRYYRAMALGIMMSDMMFANCSSAAAALLNVYNRTCVGGTGGGDANALSDFREQSSDAKLCSVAWPHT